MPCPSQPDKARFSGSPSGGQLYRLLDQHLSGAVESAELAAKIRNHPIAGTYVRDWEDDGVIPLGAKIIAITMMAAMLGYLHFGSGAPVWVVIAAASVMGLAAAYILSRPSKRSRD